MPFSMIILNLEGSNHLTNIIDKLLYNELLHVCLMIKAFFA